MPAHHKPQLNFNYQCVMEVFMLKRATILSMVMVGAAMLDAVDAHAFRGGTFRHFTQVSRLPTAVVGPSLP